MACGVETGPLCQGIGFRGGVSEFFSSDSERFMLGFLICQGGIGELGQEPQVVMARK